LKKSQVLRNIHTSTLFGVCALFLLSAYPLPLYARTNEESLTKDLQGIYTRYSRYLDSEWNLGGWKYDVPSKSYKEINRTSLNSLRMQATFSSYYSGRTDEDAKRYVQSALLNALIDLPKIQANYIPIPKGTMSTRSFHDAIGMHSALKILEKKGDLWSVEEKDLMIENARSMYPWILNAPDTENRALLGAAYGIAILNNPLMNFNDQEKKEYISLIREKVKVGMKSIAQNHRYKEGAPPRFSLHYHLVSSLMLNYVGVALNDQFYINESKAMMVLIDKHYPLGRLSVRGSMRPKGLGLQTIFMRALTEKIVGHKAWYSYWTIEGRTKGFIDPRNHDRLVWKDEVDKTYNDDYSLATIAGLLWDK